MSDIGRVGSGERGGELGVRCGMGARRSNGEGEEVAIGCGKAADAVVFAICAQERSKGVSE